MNTPLLEGFALEGLDDALRFEDMFLRSDRTNLIKGQTTLSIAKIGSKEIQIATKLNEARLDRATLMFNDRSATNKYWSLTTNIKPCAIDVTVTIDDKEMSLTELLRAQVNATRPADHQISPESFEAVLRSISYLQGSMIMITQHNAVNTDVVESLFDLMISNGAVDVLDTIPKSKQNNMRRIVSFESSPGLEISSMTLNSFDRTKSSYNRGFENLLEAQLENFKRTLSLRAVRVRAEKELAANRANLSEDEINDAMLKISTLRRNAQSWINNWGGVQEIYEVDPEDNAKRVASGRYGPTNVPCAEFVIETESGPTEINLWTRRDAGSVDLDVATKAAEASLDAI